ncbi:MAG: SPFH domain-containing protein [Adlercreutzia equolifaciens]
MGAGLNIKIPFFETIAAKVDMRTRQEQFGIDAKTRDNVTVTMAIAAQYRVSAQPAANGQPSGVWRSYYMLANPTAPDALLPHRRPALQRAAVHA